MSSNLSDLMLQPMAAPAISLTKTFRGKKKGGHFRKTITCQSMWHYRHIVSERRECARYLAWYFNILFLDQNKVIFAYSTLGVSRAWSNIKLPHLGCKHKTFIFMLLVCLKAAKKALNSFIGGVSSCQKWQSQRHAVLYFVSPSHRYPFCSSVV